MSLKIRRAIADGDSDLADKEKKSLPGFTPSAWFRISRRIEDLLGHSGIVHADFDKLGKEKLEEAVRKLIADSYTYACFKSPSGNGLKVFTKVPPATDRHELNYRAVQQHYENLLGFPADSKCKDVTRLCFMSHDPDAYLNKDSKIYRVEETSSQAWRDLLMDVQRFTEQRENFIPGNRNNFIYLFGCNANRKGIPSDRTISYCIERYVGLPHNEIATTVRSAYTKHMGDFGNFGEFVNPSYRKIEANEDILAQTPFIPEWVFPKLPRLLRDGVSVFAGGRERDLFLTSALGILSGCIPNVKGVYHKKNVYPNLYVFVVAPAASGKGSMQHAIQLADKYHEETLKRSMEELRQYKKRLKQADEADDDLVPPRFKVVFIPADVSSAKVVQHLLGNDGGGIFSETEADTMVNAFKKEWGLNSYMLRKAFQAEKISVSRKTNDEFIEITNAHPSVILSGTPNQATNLLPSAEDGLLSRFIFYIFRSELIWQDVSPDENGLNLTEYFEALGVTVYEMTRFLEANCTIVDLTRVQWRHLNTKFERHLKQIAEFITEDAASIVYRLGLIMYRICIVLSTLRKWEDRVNDSRIICSDDDFAIADALITVYLEHSVQMFKKLPKQSKPSLLIAGDRKRRFFDTLPNQFKRIDAVTIGQALGLSESLIDRFLRDVQGVLLSKSDYGHYAKLP